MVDHPSSFASEHRLLIVTSTLLALLAWRIVVAPTRAPASKHSSKPAVVTTPARRPWNAPKAPRASARRRTLGQPDIGFETSSAERGLGRRSRRAAAAAHSSTRPRRSPPPTAPPKPWERVFGSAVAARAGEQTSCLCVAWSGRDHERLVEVLAKPQVVMAVRGNAFGTISYLYVTPRGYCADASRRRRGRDVDSPSRRVAAAPRPGRG